MNELSISTPKLPAIHQILELDDNDGMQEYSVTQISQMLRESIEDKFSSVKIRGEITGYRKANSKHTYFNLKDQSSLIKAVCWGDMANSLGFQLADGLEVVATGKISTYKDQSVYQIVIKKLELAGSGALLALLEKRRADLAAEGLFDADRKQTLPLLPQVIGVVTSPTGAVIRDILHRIQDRMGLHVIIWPVLVQGSGAAPQIASAIEGFNDLPDHVPKPDIIIVARGGGSIEDLWPFNEEIVVRAAAASQIPLISAVGHETDNTLIDLAADLRAPTPTAAAEYAMPIKANLIDGLDGVARRSKLALSSLINYSENRLSTISARLINFSQQMVDREFKLNKFVNRLDRSLIDLTYRKESQLHRLIDKISPVIIAKNLEIRESSLAMLYDRLISNLHYRFNRGSDKIYELGRLLEGFSYRKILDRGFVLAMDSTTNKIIKSPAEARRAKKFTLQFSIGEVEVTTDTNQRKRKSGLVKALADIQSKLFD